jgi:hypothetical protein
MNETWWEAPMEGSVLSFLNAEWKMSDTGSAHWASSIQYTQGHIVIDVRHVGFDMSDNRSDGDRCNKKGHKTKELSQQV